MYLVEDNRFGTTYVVFMWRNPRENGFTGKMIEDVSLDYDLLAVHEWRDGEDAPDVCLGRSVNDPKRYKVFKYEAELRSAGYVPVPGTFLGVADYIKLIENPPTPELIGQEGWYDYLDRLDEGFRERGREAETFPKPVGANRDVVAEWIAREHFIADRGVREIWYLPKGAPPDEIRLMELSDRLPASETSIEAIDFGLDIEGANFHLVVADVTTDQLEIAKKDSSRLPRGWTLEGQKIWRRRGA